LGRGAAPKVAGRPPRTHPATFAVFTTFGDTPRGYRSSNQTTTRTITNVSPGSFSRTTVTRTDKGAGNTGTEGTLKNEDGQVEREGTMNGSSNDTAKVTYDHNANTVAGNRRTYEIANGTIEGGAQLQYDGEFSSQGVQAFDKIMADAERTSKENSTSTTGWSGGRPGIPNHEFKAVGGVSRRRRNCKSMSSSS
jgi:hypothetical protein